MLRPTAFVRVLAIALIPLAAACAAVGPNYERPAMPTPDKYRFIEPVAQAESNADLTWWQVFQDPTLQMLIREGIANNLDLRVAAARVEEARAKAGIAKSYLYPAVDAVAGYTVRQGTSFNGEEDASPQQAVAGGFRLSWELDFWNRVRRETESATAIALATEQGRRGVMVTLVGDVATNYFRLRELDLQLLISKDTLAVADRTVTYFQDRLDGGVSNRLEVDLIRANRARSAAAIPDLEQQIAIVENAIAMLLGRPPGPIPRAPLNSAEMLPPQIPAGMPAALLQRRPDVVEAEQLLVSANADIGVARALFYPRINLAAFIGGSTGDLVSFLGVEGALWSIGAQALQPVYQGGRLRRNLEATNARFEAALANYRRAALNSYREVANALITIQKLADSRIAHESGVVALTDAADLSRERYQAGLASYIEILKADEDLFREQLLLAQVRGAEFRARAELYRALGGGWEPEPPATTTP